MKTNSKNPDTSIMELWQQIAIANQGDLTKEQLQEILDAIHALRIQGFQKPDTEETQ